MARKKEKFFITTPTPEEIEALKKEELKPDPEEPLPELPKQLKREDLPEDPKAVSDFLSRISGPPRTIIRNSEAFAKRKLNPFSFLFENQHKLSFDEAVAALDHFIAGKEPKPPTGTTQKTISSKPEFIFYLESWTGLMAKRIDNFFRPKKA